jgi:hypothetical protein
VKRADEGVRVAMILARKQKQIHRAAMARSTSLRSE